MTDDAAPDARLRWAENRRPPNRLTRPIHPMDCIRSVGISVRDGEVPATVIHRHNGHDISHELDSAKQDLLAQTTAREQAERALAVNVSRWPRFLVCGSDLARAILSSAMGAECRSDGSGDQRCD